MVFGLFERTGRFAIGRVGWVGALENWIWEIGFNRLVFVVIFMTNKQTEVNLGEPYWTFFWVLPFAGSHGIVAVYAASDVSGTASPRGNAITLVMLTRWIRRR
jgi:hypothetical protein